MLIRTHRPVRTRTALNRNGTRQPQVRAPLADADVFPKTEGGLKTWVGVGGTPQSVVRTAKYGFPLMCAVIGGKPERFTPFIDLYKQAAADFNTTAWPVGMHSPGFIADTDDEAKEIFWLAPLQSGQGPHRSPPRLAARPPRRLRGRNPERLDVHRLTGDRRPENRACGGIAGRWSLRPHLHFRSPANQRPP
jgi:alkanesulfonate monooxygenase SsuD/methylene tetrahydromethanopterin reductase-like flavin-dependent oxidoreductase (luciferase family)